MPNALDTLGARWQKELRIRVIGDAGLAQQQVGRARLQVGIMERQRSLAGLNQAVMTREYGDGARIRTLFTGLQVIAEIDVTGVEGTTPNTAALWIPRGFVLYPVSDEQPLGWGLPIQQEETVEDGSPADVFSEVNRVPGLDTSRWTPGGPLGQVLLSKDTNAGYPVERPNPLTPPLLFHPTLGIQPDSDPLANIVAVPWKAYRLELLDYMAQSPGVGPAEQSYIVTFKRDVFKLTNAHRLDVGAKEMQLPIRGYYDSAQATAEVCNATSVLGHFYEGFAPTYKIPEDRLGKDGVTVTYVAFDIAPADFDNRNIALSGGENLTASPGGPTHVIEVDPNGFDITEVPAGPPFSGQVAFDLWLSSPEHREQIESLHYDPKGYTVLSAASLGVGCKVAYYGQHFILRDQWIGTANCIWRSKEPEVPAVSWFGFNSMNLAWETWPVRPVYDVTRHVDPPLGSFTLSARIAIVREFTTELGGTPETTVFYIDHPNDGTDTRTRPALSQRIFCRGRCIAIAPRGGLVWAAAIQKLTLSTLAGDKNIYRLVALVHHAAAQAADHIANGMTGKLHVWYCDLLDTDFIHANPNTIIRGVYGEEDSSWPWIDLNSPYSWRGEVEVNMLHTTGASDPDMLKYASAWRFSPDGKKAICLRDQGTIADLEQHFVVDGAVKVGNAPAVYTSLDGIDVLYPSGQFGLFTGGPGVVYVELSFESDPDGAGGFADITVEKSTSERNRGGVPHLMLDGFTAATGQRFGPAAWTRPCAVDYDADGNKVFAFHVTGWYGGALFIPSGFSGIFADNWRQGVVFGDWDTVWSDCVARGVFYSNVAALDGEDLFALPATILDVRDRVFCAFGPPSPVNDMGPGVFATDQFANYPDSFPADVDPFHAGYRAGAFTATCLECNNVPTSYTLRMWRGTQKILEGSADNSDNTLYDLRLTPFDSNIVDTGLPYETPTEITNGYFLNGYCLPSANPCMSASYARNTDGEWVATLLYMPQPTYTTTFDPAGDTTAFGTDQSDSSQCLNDCGVATHRDVTFVAAGAVVARDGGGWMTSSFASSADLADLMQIPGTNPRSLYARAV